MKRGTLYIFSGLPGAGKSTLASKLASHLKATYLRIDTVEQALRDLCHINEVDGKGYGIAHRIARENLQTGISVVADSVNPWSLTRQEWNEVASQMGAQFVNIEIICSDRNEHKTRIESRKSTVPGLKAVSWAEVLERDYQDWQQPRHVVDSSGKTVEAAFNELLSVLQKSGAS